MSSRVKNFVPVLPVELLEKYNFFELYPFDGGGSFVNRAILGGIDDQSITRQIVEKDALYEYGPVDEIDFRRYERWQTIEKSCWINRMYFVVPMARTAAMNNDKKLAERIRQIILRFYRLYRPPVDKAAVRKLNWQVEYDRDHGYNTSGADFDGPAPYQWFDFQPASRLLHILYAVWFIKDLQVFSNEDYLLLDDMIAEHARVIADAYETGDPILPGNHEALRALAMLIAGVLLKDHAEAPQWRQEGFRMTQEHILLDFLEDGMCTDLSPSYHFFMTWIIRDAVLWAKRGGLEFSAEAVDRFKAACSICRCFQLPDGMTPVISDGYPLDMSVFYLTLAGTDSSSKCGYKLLPASKMAIYQSDNSYALMDCSPLLEKFAHYHCGKQALTLWFKNRAFIEDCGCCNYDEKLFIDFFKTARAHATLIVDGLGDGELEGRYCWNQAAECVLGSWQNSRITSHEQSTVWGNVQWRRELQVDDSGAEIIDHIHNAENRHWQLIFPLAPEVAAEPLNGSGSWRLNNNGVEVIFSSGLPAEIVESCSVRNFVIVKSKALKITGSGDFTVWITLKVQ